MLAASYGCRVLAFEPQPHAHPFINASIVLNGWQGRVRAIRAAVSDDTRTGMKLVNRGGWGNWDISELAPESDEEDGIEVLGSIQRLLLPSAPRSRPIPDSLSHFALLSVVSLYTPGPPLQLSCRFTFPLFPRFTSGAGE